MLQREQQISRIEKTESTQFNRTPLNIAHNWMSNVSHPSHDFLRTRPGHCLQFCVPIRPRRRPIVQWHPSGIWRGQEAIPRPIVQRPIGHCASPVALLCSPLPRPFCDVSGAPLGSPQRSRTAPGTGWRSLPPLCAPRWRSNSDHAGKRYVLGRNRESRSRPRNCDSRPGNAISCELTSLGFEPGMKEWTVIEY